MTATILRASGPAAFNVGGYSWDLRSAQQDTDDECKAVFGFAPNDNPTLAELAERVHDADRAAWLRARAACAEQGADLNLEYRVVWPNGRTRRVLERARIARDNQGRPLLIAGTCVDVTPWEELTEQLREGEDRLRLALSAAKIGTWDYDLGEAVARCDERCKALFGLPPWAEVSVELLLAAMHAEDRERTTQLVRRALDPASDGAFESEFRAIGVEDGIERWLAARGRVHVQAGVGTRFVGTVLDITDRKRSERERTQLLERERRARITAETASRLKDDFLATVSHELRTPLSAILGWAQMLCSGRLSPERCQQGIQTIERNARAQMQLINDILDVSRIVTGKLAIQRESVSLRAVVEAALDTVRAAAEAKGIRLLFDFDDGVPDVQGDADRLQQVVWNLLSNAVKFTPRDGQVAVTIRAGKASVEIEVSDTGKGIPLWFVPFVFDRFRQAEGGTTRTDSGLGLGLAIVRHLVELHGGTVAASSGGEGMGAMFKIVLPVAHSGSASGGASEAPPLSVRPPQPDPKVLEGIRVLVVDDELDNRELMALMLQQFGATVVTADSAAEGMTLLGSNTPDVLVSDIAMPSADGYAFIGQVRTLPASHPALGIPAIALTAYARDEDQQAALAAGFDLHVTKPVRAEALVEAIAGLAKSRAQR